MPSALARQWRECEDRTFDIGFEIEPGTSPVTMGLSTKSLSDLGEIGAELRLTFYRAA
jgi:hypothetical protein